MDSATAPGTPSLLRVINERALLGHLRAAGEPMSRAQLARETRLSKPTVSQALAHLERAGLVRALGARVAARGRAAVLYEPDPAAAHVLGVDIGAEWVRVARADLSGAVVERFEERHRARSAGDLVARVAKIAGATVGGGELSGQVIHAVVGCPGVYDRASGELRYAPNVPGSRRRGLVDGLVRALGGSVEIHNDVNLAAIAEHAVGRGRGLRDLVYVSVGTGVGMGVVIDGALHIGAHGAAGEIGFHPFPAPEPVQPLRAPAQVNAADPARPGRPARGGAFEDAAGAAGVARTARALGMGSRQSVRRTFEAARRGDPTALEVVRVEAERLAFLVASVAAILDPELIVLGGGVGGNTDLLLEPLQRRLRELTPLRPRVASSELGQDAVVRGAIATALDVGRELAFQRLTGTGAEGRLAATATS